MYGEKIKYQLLVSTVKSEKDQNKNPQNFGAQTKPKKSFENE